MLQHFIYWVFKLQSCVMERKSKFYVEVGKMHLYLLMKSKKKKEKPAFLQVRVCSKFPDLFIKQNSNF